MRVGAVCVVHDRCMRHAARATSRGWRLLNVDEMHAHMYERMHVHVCEWHLLNVDEISDQDAHHKPSNQALVSEAQRKPRRCHLAWRERRQRDEARDSSLVRREGGVPAQVSS